MLKDSNDACKLYTFNGQKNSGSFYVARLTVDANHNRIKFGRGPTMTWGWNTYNHQSLNYDISGAYNLYELYTNKQYNTGNQECNVIKPVVDGSGTPSSTKSLYFIPCYKWKAYSPSYYNNRNPHIYFQWFDDEGLIRQNAPWPGVQYSAVTSDYVYTFSNVQDSSIHQLTILYGSDKTSGQIPRLDFNADTINQWQNNGKNIFGMASDEWYAYSTDTPVSLNSDYYEAKESKAFVLGSFNSWKQTPVSEVAYFEKEGSEYIYSTGISANTVFKYITGAYLSNTSSSGSAASWGMVGTWRGYNASDIEVYEHHDLDNPVSNKSDYVVDDGTDNHNIKLLKAGYVTFVRTTSTDTAGIKIIYYSYHNGDALYFDITAVHSTWTADGAIIKAHLWNTDNTSISYDVEMFEIHGHNTSNHIYELNISTLSSGKIPNMVLFYRKDPNSETWWNKTLDLNMPNDVKTNKYVLNGYKWEGEGDNYGKYLGDWSGAISDEERALHYGNYFNSITDGKAGGACSASGQTDHTVLQNSWRLLNDEYNHMATYARGEVWKSAGKGEGSGGTSLELAMGRYDYIVFTKHYTFETDDHTDITDFIGRNDSPGKSPASAISYKGGFSSLVLNDDNSFSTIIIIIASSISLLSITALSVLVIKKRKSKEQ